MARAGGVLPLPGRTSASSRTATGNLRRLSQCLGRASARLRTDEDIRPLCRMLALPTGAVPPAVIFNRKVRVPDSVGTYAGAATAALSSTSPDPGRNRAPEHRAGHR